MTAAEERGAAGGAQLAGGATEAGELPVGSGETPGKLVTVDRHVRIVADRR